MEVFKRAILCSVFLFLSACASNDQSGKFTKSTSFECYGAEVEGQYLVNWKDGSISVEHAKTDSEFVNDFLVKHDSEVDFAEPDYLIRPNEDIPATKTTDAASQANWGAYRIKAETAWTQNYSGQGIVVAVVDSGVDITHPQLVNQIEVNSAERNGKAGVDDDQNGLVDDVYGWNFMNNTPNVYDDSGHGSHIAGVISAEHGKGNTLGVAPSAKILPVDFMDSRGGTSSAAINSLIYAANRGAKVINASWGSRSCSQSLQSVMSNLQSSEVLIVVAAGNGDSRGVGMDISVFPEYPAAFHMKNQITVGALDPSGYMASFSNYGSLVDLLAPGVGIESTVPSGYETMRGTSMAAPFVAGAAAVLWSKKPSASVSEIKSAILNSLENLSSQNLPRGKLRLDQALNQL